MILRMFGPEPIIRDYVFITFRGLHAASPVASKNLSFARSFCRSSMLFEEREMAVSLAYMLTSDFCKEKGKLLMQIRNKSGPRQEP